MERDHLCGKRRLAAPVPRIETSARLNLEEGEGETDRILDFPTPRMRQRWLMALPALMCALTESLTLSVVCPPCPCPDDEEACEEPTSMRRKSPWMSGEW